MSYYFGKSYNGKTIKNGTDLCAFILDEGHVALVPGAAFGDEGSAYWIGREALALVSMHLDGRATCDAFASGLLARLGLDPGGLITWAYGQTNLRATMAGVARHVSAMASLGDAGAQGLMTRAGVHLAALGLAAARSSGAETPLRWSYAGGVFADTDLRQTVATQIGIDPEPPRLPPVGGAILTAARHLGWTIDAGFIQRLNAALTSQMPLQPLEVTP